ncbi:acetamidase/formamidase family protein [Candidatus Latescibacterota bacterium]
MNRALFARIVLSLAVVSSLIFAHLSFGQESIPKLDKIHHFEATNYYNTFSFAHAPVLRIKPGDRVITRTIDAGGYDDKNTKVAQGGNPQTGPFYIEGAEPGDVLVVRLERIKPNRKTAYSNKVLAPYVADPVFLHFEALQERQGRETWNVELAKGIARTTSDNIQPLNIEVPVHPMLGCVGVAPSRKEAVSTSNPGKFGGNMDYFGMNEGVVLMLPVYEPGALLFIGDGHVRQSHGEVLGNALEISMDVEFTVDLIKNKSIGWPRLENDEYIMVLGSARPLLQALQHATTELLRWLMNDYGFDECGASLLMGHVLEYEIANVVDPHFTVVAKIKKMFLQGSH